MEFERVKVVIGKGDTPEKAAAEMEAAVVAFLAGEVNEVVDFYSGIELRGSQSPKSSNSSISSATASGFSLVYEAVSRRWVSAVALSYGINPDDHGSDA